MTKGKSINHLPVDMRTPAHTSARELMPTMMMPARSSCSCKQMKARHCTVTAQSASLIQAVSLPRGGGASGQGRRRGSQPPPVPKKDLVLDQFGRQLWELQRIQTPQIVPHNIKPQHPVAPTRNRSQPIFHKALSFEPIFKVNWSMKSQPIFNVAPRSEHFLAADLHAWASHVPHLRVPPQIHCDSDLQAARCTYTVFLLSCNFS